MAIASEAHQTEELRCLKVTADSAEPLRFELQSTSLLISDSHGLLNWEMQDCDFEARN